MKIIIIFCFHIFPIILCQPKSEWHFYLQCTSSNLVLTVNPDDTKNHFLSMAEKNYYDGKYQFWDFKHYKDTSYGWLVSAELDDLVISVNTSRDHYPSVYPWLRGWKRNDEKLDYQLWTVIENSKFQSKAYPDLVWRPYRNTDNKVYVELKESSRVRPSPKCIDCWTTVHRHSEFALTSPLDDHRTALTIYESDLLNQRMTLQMMKIEKLPTQFWTFEHYTEEYFYIRSADKNRLVITVINFHLVGSSSHAILVAEERKYPASDDQLWKGVSQYGDHHQSPYATKLNPNYVMDIIYGQITSETAIIVWENKHQLEPREKCNQCWGRFFPGPNP